MRLAKSFRFFTLSSLRDRLTSHTETQRAAVWLTLTFSIAAYGQIAAQQAQHWVDHTFQVLEQIQHIEAFLLSAQTEFLRHKKGDVIPAAYRIRVEQATTRTDRLKLLTRDNQVQQDYVNSLQHWLKEDELEPNKRFSDVQRLIRAIQLEERTLLERRQAWAVRQQILSASGLIASMLITMFALTQVQREQKRLKLASVALDDRLNEIQSEQTLSSYLLTCRSQEEAYELLRLFMTYLLPSCNGVIYTINNSRDQMTPTVVFGDFKPVPYAAPKECWALRRGDIQSTKKVGFQIPCQLCKAMDSSESEKLCFSLQAHQEVIGILHLLDVPLEKRKSIMTFAHQVALPLAVIKLQSALEHLGFHDALTGLHNRRFLDEALPLQIAQAQRSGTKIGIVLIDVDNFKRWNDVHSHLAGDAVLSEIGRVLKRCVRSSDIAVRWGGEELMTIFLDIEAEKLLEKAEQIRQDVEHIIFTYEGVVLSGITISIGLSSYPQDGGDAETLFRAADAALLKAKKNGKNRVVWLANDV